MSRTAQDVLEFDKLRELLRLRTTCAPGRRAIDALEFGTNRPALEAAFALIREAREWLRGGGELGFGGLADPYAWLEKIEGPGIVLEAKELLEAASLLETSAWLRGQFREDAAKFPLLASRAASLGDFRDALTAVRRCVLPNGEISDDASPALRRIRASISQTRESIQKTLKQILRSRNAAAGEDYVTLRNDRFVIPVRSENRRSVPGIVHGASGTGQTVFLEPLETVEANNELTQLSEDEAAEIIRDSARADRAAADRSRTVARGGRNHRRARWYFCTRPVFRVTSTRRCRSFLTLQNYVWLMRAIRFSKTSCAAKIVQWFR